MAQGPSHVRVPPEPESVANEIVIAATCSAADDFFGAAFGLYSPGFAEGDIERRSKLLNLLRAHGFAPKRLTEKVFESSVAMVSASDAAGSWSALPALLNNNNSAAVNAAVVDAGYKKLKALKSDAGLPEAAVSLVVRASKQLPSSRVQSLLTEALSRDKAPSLWANLSMLAMGIEQPDLRSLIRTRAERALEGAESSDLAALKFFQEHGSALELKPTPAITAALFEDAFKAKNWALAAQLLAANENTKTKANAAARKMRLVQAAIDGLPALEARINDARETSLRANLEAVAKLGPKARDMLKSRVIDRLRKSEQLSVAVQQREVKRAVDTNLVTKSEAAQILLEKVSLEGDVDLATARLTALRSTLGDSVCSTPYVAALIRRAFAAETTAAMQRFLFLMKDPTNKAVVSKAIVAAWDGAAADCVARSHMLQNATMLKMLGNSVLEPRDMTECCG